MTRFAFDLYPRTDPKNGARLVRFTQLQLAEYEKQADGTGAGKIAIRATKSDAAFIDPAGLQYVRVVLIKDDLSEVPYGGFFLENGDFEALTERSTKLLTFAGKGTLGVMERTVAAEQSYLFSDPSLQPVDGAWRWGTQAYGKILRRMVNESLAATRPQDPIGMVTMDFSNTLDSAGNAWPTDIAAFTFPIGRPLTELIRDLMALGLHVGMTSEFVLQAWGTMPGTDRTGLSWGAGVVRFQTPTDGTIATGNIKSEARRGLQAFIKRSDILAGNAEDGYVWQAGTADIDWEGFVHAEGTEASRQAVATAQLDARDDAGDVVRLRTRFGEDPTNGIVAPGVHYDVFDLVTLDNGSGTWDWDETSQRVMAVIIKLREDSDWDVWVDLGSRYASIAERAFANQPVGAHTHPLNLCTPGFACSDLPSELLDPETATNGDVESGATNWSGGGVDVTRKHTGVQGYSATGASVAIEYAFGAQVFTAGVRYVLDIWRRTLSPEDHNTTTLRLGVAGGDDESKIYVGGPGNDPPDLWEEQDTGADGAAWFRGRICWTPSADRTGVRLRFESVAFASTTHAVDDLALYTTDNDELAGTSSCGVHGDHSHDALDVRFLPGGTPLTATNVQDAIVEHVTDATDAHDASAISAADAGGYFTGTDVEAQLQEIGADLAGGVSDHGALTGLADDDHPQYLRATDGEKHQINVVAASGTTETLDLADGNVHDVTLTANCTLTLAGATAGVACRMAVLLRQDGTGSRTVTWPVSVVWVGGSAPTLETAANAWNWVVLVSLDGGTTWFGDGGGSLVNELDDLTDVTITSPAEGDRLRHNGTVWVNADETTSGHYEVLMAEGAASPPDPLETGDGTDWLYVWVTG